MRKLRKGFTIVELVIVIAVIAVLTAVLIPTFIHLTKKAKTSVDASLVANLNKALVIEEEETGKKPETMYDAVQGLKNQGFLVAQLITKSDDDLVYSVEKNKFFLSSDVDASKKHEYWHIESSVPAEQTWSIYAYNWNGDSATGLTVGFDAGEEEGIKNVSFVGGHDAILRTNSLETSLSINAPTNHVKRFGKAYLVEPCITANNSLEDRGYASWVTLTGGRFVVTPNTKVDYLFLDVDKNDSEQALSITLENNATMPEIVKPVLGLKDDETVKIVEVTTPEKTETLYLRGNSTIEDGQVFSSTDGGETLVPVTAETASPTAVAIANAKEAGKVVETGMTEEQKASAVVDAKTAAEVEEMREETGEDLSNYAARIGYKGYETFKAAYDAAQAGETISLMKDVSISASGNIDLRYFWILKNITIDGCNYTATVNQQRGFGICSENVTFKNITIATSSTSERCIDVRNGVVANTYVEELTLDHVTLTTATHKSGYDQPLTVGGNSTNFRDANNNVRKTKINVINHSAILTNNDAKAYYAIITFNPIELNIKDSSLKGWANVYFKGADSSYGSKGSVLNIDNCDMHSNNVYNGSSNAFAMIMLEDGTAAEKITVNIKNSNLNIDANSDQLQSLIGKSNGYVFELNVLEGNEVHFNGQNAVVAINGNGGTCSVANGNVVYSEQIESTGVSNVLSASQELREDGNGKYTVVAK